MRSPTGTTLPRSGARSKACASTPSTTSLRLGAGNYRCPGRGHREGVPGDLTATSLCRAWPPTATGSTILRRSAGFRHPHRPLRSEQGDKRACLVSHVSRVEVSVVTIRPPFVYGPDNPFYREAFFWTGSASIAPSSFRRRQPADAVRLCKRPGRSVFQCARKAYRAWPRFNVADEKRSPRWTRLTSSPGLWESNPYCTVRAN